jgi:hypothetical protein
MIDVRPIRIKVVNVTGVKAANRQDQNEIQLRFMQGRRRINWTLAACIIEGAIIALIFLYRVLVVN